jgi:hypothetical protein
VGGDSQLLGLFKGNSETTKRRWLLSGPLAWPDAFLLASKKSAFLRFLQNVGVCFKGQQSAANFPVKYLV